MSGDNRRNQTAKQDIGVQSLCVIGAVKNKVKGHRSASVASIEACEVPPHEPRPPPTGSEDVMDSLIPGVDDKTEALHERIRYLENLVRGYEVLKTVAQEKHELYQHWKKRALIAEKSLSTMPSLSESFSVDTQGVPKINSQQTAQFRDVRDRQPAAVSESNELNLQEDLEPSCARCQAAGSQTDNSEAIAAYKAENEALKHQITTLLEDFNRHIKEREKLIDQLTKSQRDYDTLRAERAADRKQCLKLDVEVIQLRDDNERLRKMLRQHETTTSTTVSTVSTPLTSRVASSPPTRRDPVVPSLHSAAAAGKLPRLIPSLNWTCSVCTLQNEGASSMCEMCGSVREIRSTIEMDGSAD